MKAALVFASFVWVLLSAQTAACAGQDSLTPTPMRDVRLENRIGQAANLEVTFEDRHGRVVRLGDLLHGDKPVLLVLAYYRCPMLCDLTLRGVARGLAQLRWNPPEDYQVITVSFDPRDRPDSAERSRAAIVAEMGRELGDDAWPFLVGEDHQIRKLTDSLGFYYTYDPKTDQYAHPSGIFFLTPDGSVSRVLQGFEVPALDLRMALLDAGQGKTGTSFEQVLLTCFRYDPATRRYGPYIVGFLRLGAVLVLSTLACAYLLVGRHTRKRAAASRQEGSR
jgi:protein SCO1/2